MTSLISDKSIQDRIYLAAMGLHTLNEEDFPEDLKSDFRVLKNNLTKSGSFKESAHQMSNDDALRIAEIIFRLYTNVIKNPAS